MLKYQLQCISGYIKLSKSSCVYSLGKTYIIMGSTDAFLRTFPNKMLFGRLLSEGGTGGGCMPHSLRTDICIRIQNCVGEEDNIFVCIISSFTCVQLKFTTIYTFEEKLSKSVQVSYICIATYHKSLICTIQSVQHVQHPLSLTLDNGKTKPLMGKKK